MRQVSGLEVHQGRDYEAGQGRFPDGECVLLRGLLPEGGNLISWVHDACNEWGRQMRKRSRDQGYPPRSLLGKLVEEGPGAGSSGFYQHVPQMLEGDGLAVSLAVRKMCDTLSMEGQCIVVIAHYLFPGKAAGKARALALDMQTYWRHLHSGHSFIAACIDQPERQVA